MAYQVTPTISSDGTVSYDNARVENSDYSEFLGSRGIEQDSDEDYYFDQSTGSYRHRYADIDGEELEYRIEGPTDEYQYSQDSYEEAVLETFPQLPNALAWASENLPEDFIDAYNEALEQDDLDTYYSCLEYLLLQFSEAVNQEVGYEEEEEEVEEEEQVEEELTEEEQQILSEAIEDLQTRDPQGEEVAEEWQSLVDQYHDSDPTFAGIAAATAAFHEGEVSAQEAIDYVLQTYPLADVARVYQHLNSLY